MWLLLPFDAVDSDLSIDCLKVAFDYIDISGVPQVRLVGNSGSDLCSCNAYTDVQM